MDWLPFVFYVGIVIILVLGLPLYLLGAWLAFIRGADDRA